MLDVAPSEFLILAVVALVVIGPKDLPKAMRVLGYWVGKARGVARQFRSGFDSMVREAELAEMEKKWAAENARILAEHPASGAGDAAAGTTGNAAATPAAVAPAASSDGAGPPHDADQSDRFAPPVMVEKPIVTSAAAETAPATDGKANS